MRKVDISRISSQNELSDNAENAATGNFVGVHRERETARKMPTHQDLCSRRRDRERIMFGTQGLVSPLVDLASVDASGQR